MGAISDPEWQVPDDLCDVVEISGPRHWAVHFRDRMVVAAVAPLDSEVQSSFTHSLSSRIRASL